MLGLIYREVIPRARLYFLLFLLVAVPIIAIFHAICFFLDGLLFPSLWRLQIRQPVFLVGHARSGTTLVHRLMIEDADRFSSFLLWEFYFPSLLQKKSVRWGARMDAKWLGGALARQADAFDERR